MPTPPEIVAIPIDAKIASRLASAREFFLGHEPLKLGQAWLDRPEEGFRHGSVWAGCTPEDLVVFAVLEDADIFNGATGPNERTWMLGDVFEIFLRAEGQETYYEFHITPENHRLQLRFPDAAWFRGLGAKGNRLEDAFLEGDVIAAETLIEKDHDRWSVLARIPRATIAGSADGVDAFRFSFCRYDYTRGCDVPVLSSTSPYSPLVTYHEQSAWGTLRC